MNRQEGVTQRRDRERKREGGRGEGRREREKRERRERENLYTFVSILKWFYVLRIFFLILKLV